MRRISLGLLGLVVTAVACAEARPGSRFPQPGHRAPEFSLPSAEGGDIALSDFRGRQVLLYFSMGPG